MPKVVLLPSWNIQPSWDDVIGKVFEPDKDLPGEWRPSIDEQAKIEDIEAFAFPTPFAWAEIMSAVIRQGFYNHLLFKLYSDLTIGLVLGHLQLEIVDLKTTTFGKVLASTDERYRYFGLLRGKQGNRELQDKVFGATSPETLFWPSPRRTTAEWQELKTAINMDGAQQEAYALLADFREAIDQQKLWSPGEIPWMKGLDQIIGSHEPSEGRKHYHVHSRAVGPILADLPKGFSRPLYFPIYQEMFAPKLLEALTGTFEQERDSIAVFDDKRRKHYMIRMPTVPTDGDSLLAGAGNVEIMTEPGKIREFASTRIRLADDEQGRGLFYLLQPLDEALRKDQSLYRSLGKSVEMVKDYPFFYPDVIRISIRRLGEAGVRDSDVSFSDRAFELALKPDSPGLPLASELTKLAVSTLGFVLQYDYEGKTRRALYIDEYAGYDIGDLKALGWVLWAFFNGNAEYNNGQIVDSSLTLLLRDGTTGRPFDVASEAYKRMVEEREQHRRLATLQRFVKAYDKLASAADSSDLDKLCALAAGAYAKLVWGGGVLPNGQEAKWQPYKTGRFKVNLAVDGLKEKAYGV
jgi:hypothetical protein